MTDQVNLKVLLEKANDVMAAFEEKKKAVEASPELKAIDDLRVEFLGRKGLITGLMEHMKGLSKEERPEAGKSINVLRKSVEATIETLKAKAENWQLEKHLSDRKLDISLPANSSDEKVPAVHAYFQAMPFMHSEDLAMQDLGIKQFEYLVENNEGEAKKMMEMALDFAHKHRDIIVKFGRFPHRNKALYRESTQEEVEFLKGPNSSF